MKINNLRKPDGKVPQKSILRTTNPADVSERLPGDTQPFTTQGNDHSPMGTKVGKVTKQPSPAGTRPMSVTANLPKRTGPGIVHSQGSVRNARPAAKGLNQSIGGVKRPNSSRRGPGLQATVRPVIKHQSGAGLQKTASVQKTRNMRGPGANPAFYGDF